MKNKFNVMLTNILKLLLTRFDPFQCPSFKILKTDLQKQKNMNVFP